VEILLKINRLKYFLFFIFYIFIMVKQMVKKMKMAHKLMVLVGSVIVVAVVIVLIQLRTSAQLADGGDGLLQCDTNVCQSAVNCEGPGPCTTSPVCSQAECKDCTRCQ